MTDTECRAEQQKFQIETQQQIRKIYALFARGEELSIKAEQRRIAAEKQRAKEAKQRTEAAKKSSQELRESIKKLSDETRQAGKKWGGIGNNIDSVTEEFFFKAMSADMRVGSIVFDTIKRNIHHKSADGTKTGELDLVLHLHSFTSATSRLP